MPHGFTYLMRLSSEDPSSERYRPAEQPERVSCAHRPQQPAIDAEPSGGHYELAVEEPVTRRVAVAFDEVTLAI